MELSPPILQTFLTLLKEAEDAGEPEPIAMTLATAGADGAVGARIVLLKEVTAKGFVFYTNSLSFKGKQLAQNPRAALLFHWKRLRDGVQVRVEGAVEKVAPAEADIYFATRPRESQIGAWASQQSRALDARATLEQRIAYYQALFQDQTVSRPPHWSGYRVLPSRVEFWHAEPFRLHRRDCYRWKDHAWQYQTLYP